VEATITGLDARDARPATLTLAFADAHGAQGKVEGTVAIEPYRIEAVADVAGVKLTHWIVPWQAAMPARLLDLLFPWVIWVVSLRSSDRVQRFSPPLRSDTKTTFLPSGLNRGWASKAGPLVSRVAVPPAIGRV
jgi:hypothetical protein